MTGLHPRISIAIGLLVTFYVLFFFLVTTYLRLLTTVIFSPGYLPRGPQWSNSDKHGKRKGGKGHKRSGSSDREKTEVIPYTTLSQPNANDEKSIHPLDTTGLEAFYMKDAFVCQLDGKPPWCSTCCQFKTDRSHHCSEVNRCVRKMDHFCPWYDHPPI